MERLSIQLRDCLAKRSSKNKHLAFCKSFRNIGDGIPKIAELWPIDIFNVYTPSACLTAKKEQELSSAVTDVSHQTGIAILSLAGSLALVMVA